MEKKRDREIAETVSDFFDSRREESGNCPKVYAGITEAYRIFRWYEDFQTEDT